MVLFGYVWSYMVLRSYAKFLCLFWFSNITYLKFSHPRKFESTENIRIFFLRFYSDVEICVKCKGMPEDNSMIRKLFIATQTHSLVEGLHLYLRRLMNSHYPEAFYQWYIWCKIIEILNDYKSVKTSSTSQMSLHLNNLEIQTNRWKKDCQTLCCFISGIALYSKVL